MAQESKIIDGINFKITRKIIDNQIIKEINFKDKGETFTFQESVKLLTIIDFKLYLQEVGLKVMHTFGNYNLDEFQENSDRLIIIAKKIE